MAALFSADKKKWYKESAVKKYAAAYYRLLRKILKQVSPKYRVLACCKECGIYFLTSPSNRGRKDLRCPFGCRAHHTYMQSQYRSWKYRKTDCGKEKKANLNKKRDRTSENNIRKEKDNTPLNKEEHRDVAVHMRFIMQLLLQQHVRWDEMFTILYNFFNKWRQRSLYTHMEPG